MVKNHPFLDDGKRIAATMFLFFLDRNGALYDKGQKRVADSTLVAITVMIAESKPEEKDTMVALVMNFLTGWLGDHPRRRSGAFVEVTNDSLLPVIYWWCSKGRRRAMGVAAACALDFAPDRPTACRGRFIPRYNESRNTTGAA